jgi:hypothetical protein
MTFEFTSFDISQQTPFSNNSSSVVVRFSIVGDLPNFVQVYANTGNIGSVDLGNLKCLVPLNSSTTNYSCLIDHLIPGLIYIIGICPRTGALPNLDEKINDDSWEGYCHWKTLSTQGTNPSVGTVEHHPPTIVGFDVRFATISTPQAVHVTWKAAETYLKYHLGWRKKSEQFNNEQVEINTHSDTASGLCSPTYPGTTYIFSVQGEWNEDFYGISPSRWSAWSSPIEFTTPPNINSLATYLQASGVNTRSLLLKSLLGPTNSLRAFMKL